MSRKLLSILSVIACFSLNADEKLNTESPIIMGSASDSQTSQPIAGMLIEVFDTSGIYIASTSTDQSGAYRIALKTSGSFYVRTFDIEQKYTDELYNNIPCCYICSDYVPCDKRCDVDTGTILAVTRTTTINFSLDPEGGCTQAEVHYPATYSLFSDFFENKDFNNNWGSWRIQRGGWKIQAGQLFNTSENSTIIFELRKPDNYQKDDIYTLAARFKFATRGTVALSSWFVDESNNFDFVMDEESDQCTIRQTIQGRTTMLQKSHCKLNTGKFYKLQISLKRDDFAVYLQDDVAGFQETSELHFTKVNKGSFGNIPWGKTSIKVIAGTAYFDDLELSQFVDVLIDDK